MAISSKNAFKKSPSSSSSRPNLTKIWGVQKNLVKNRATWEVKKSRAKKRLIDLTIEIEKAESGNMDNTTLCHETDANSNVYPYSGSGVSTFAMERARVIQQNLSPRLPSCLKLMLGSHVSGGFWLGMPKQFSDMHLPKNDDTVVLVDEDGHEYNTRYLANKNGLSGGWRGFSIAHKLLAGDVLIFQLIEPCKLKVYIVRGNGLTKVDRSNDLVGLDVLEKAINIDHRPGDKPHLEALVECNRQEKNASFSISTSEHFTDAYCDVCDNLGPEVVEGIRFSETIVDFKDVKCIEDFSVHVNGLILDSEIPSHVRPKYYNLCYSQKKFLHKNLIEGLNSTLAAGMISEIINISDAIKSVKLTTSLHHLETWDKTLKAFQDLGMAVGFLRARIHKLATLFQESRAAIESKLKERDEAEQEINALGAKLANVKALVKRLDAEILDLEVKHEDCVSSIFREVTGA